MKAKQKAEELIEKFHDVAERYWAHSLGFLPPEYSGKLLRENKRRCALIAVEEILGIDSQQFIFSANQQKFWEEVKQQIISL